MHVHTCSYVVSEPYSRIPGDRNWRYRVVDIHIFVNDLHIDCPSCRRLWREATRTYMD